MDIIESITNPFGGIIPEPSKLPNDPKLFKSQLGHSLKAWRDDGYKVVWLEVHASLAQLIPIAVEAGFSFHHAKDDYVMLTFQIQKDAFIPPYATHYVGVGGVVLNGSSELLVVSERHRQRGRGPSYKLPGGALQPGEHLVQAVHREVLEETGIQTRFDSLVCFRHWHGYRHDKSDIYFVCRLSPLSNDITMQVEEIEECLWMNVYDYLDAETVSQFNKRIVRAALESPGIQPAWIDGYGDPQRYEFFLPQNME